MNGAKSLSQDYHQAKNELKFRTSCVAIFGNECCTECRTIGRLFDRMDYTVYPPSNNNGGLGYSPDDG